MSKYTANQKNKLNIKLNKINIKNEKDIMNVKVKDLRKLRETDKISMKDIEMIWKMQDAIEDKSLWQFFVNNE